MYIDRSHYTNKYNACMQLPLLNLLMVNKGREVDGQRKGSEVLKESCELKLDSTNFHPQNCMSTVDQPKYCRML